MTKAFRRFPKLGRANGSRRITPRRGLEALGGLAGESLHHIGDAAFKRERPFLDILHVIADAADLEGIHALLTRDLGQQPNRHIHADNRVADRLGHHPRHIATIQQFGARGAIALSGVALRTLRQKDRRDPGDILIRDRRGLARLGEHGIDAEQGGEVDHA